MPLEFRSSFQLNFKKTWFDGGARMVNFVKSEANTDSTQLHTKGKTLFVHIGPGLPNNSSNFYSNISKNGQLIFAYCSNIN